MLGTETFVLGSMCVCEGGGGVAHTLPYVSEGWVKCVLQS